MIQMKRVARPTLVCGAVVVLAALLCYARASAQQASGPFSADTSKQAGRFQIVMHPTIRADQYLLDTVTGQVWQLTSFSSLKSEPTAWSYMTRIDNGSDMT